MSEERDMEKTPVVRPEAAPEVKETAKPPMEKEAAGLPLEKEKAGLPVERQKPVFRQKRKRPGYLRLLQRKRKRCMWILRNRIWK